MALSCGGGQAGQGYPCVMESVGFEAYNSTTTGDKSATLGVNCGMSTGRNGVVEQVPYTLKIRSGCEGGGKGALIQTDKSATLSTLNDQYLFQPVIDCHILDDQGGSQISVRDDGKCPTLRAEMHGNVPCVLKEQHLFENHSQDSRYRGPLDVCPMLPAQLGTGGNNQPFVVESQPIKCYDIGEARLRTPSEYEEISPTLTARCGTGGNNVPAVVEGKPVYCPQGGGATSQNSQGMGYKTSTSYTLNTTDLHAVAFQTYQKVTSPLMANSHPGSYTGQDAFSDMLVAGPNVQYVDTTHADDVIRVDDVTAPLQQRDYKGGKLVTYGVDCRNATEYPELTGALQADSAHNLNSNNVVRVQYIVRRLTPTECARLQGFPDTWGHPDEKSEFTDEEYQFWLNVRNTHAVINDKAAKEYTKDQILKWYNALHTDSSEYKMWGNGIALPNALYMMQGITEVMSEEKAARRKWLHDLLGDCL
jgi:DNA (cytosine-5)-methyltransferase 1